MKHSNVWFDLMMSFFVVTACVCILEAVLGMLLFPEIRFGYDAFLSPPLFGLLSSLLGIVTYSKKELTVRQAMIRKVLHLVLIELLVFGLNAYAGHFFEAVQFISIMISIAVVYVTVNAVLWVNDQRSAAKFNQELKEFQRNNQMS